MSLPAIDYGDVRAVAAATKRLVTRWRKAYFDMRKASTARMNLDASASRAQLTSANARHARAAEAFDALDAELHQWSETVDPLNISVLRSQASADYSRQSPAPAHEGSQG